MSKDRKKPSNEGIQTVKPLRKKSSPPMTTVPRTRPDPSPEERSLFGFQISNLKPPAPK